MAEGESPRESRKIKIKAFNAFQEDFVREIGLPEFGGHIRSLVNADSRTPAAKELKKTGAFRILSSNGFLHFAHGLLRKYSRLPEEQNKVRQVSAEIGRSIKRLRDAQKTLQRLQEKIKELDEQWTNVLSWDNRTRLDKAVKELMFVEDALCSVEQREASDIHPEIRKKHDKSAGTKRKHLEYSLSWQSMIPRFDYELDSLRKKAPQQWLIEALDAGFARRCKSAKIKLSSMTRYQIIAEVLLSGGMQEISAYTIKQHFIEKKKQKSPSQLPTRKLPATQNFPRFF